MGKTSLTDDVEKLLWLNTKKLGVFGCFEVTIGRAGKERVDYMTFDTKGVWRCYEIKTSLSDFRSKAKKTFIGHYNYYVLTHELYEKVKNEIPKEIGVFIHNRVVKPPKKQELKVDEEILYYSMIRSLYRENEKLMWQEVKQWREKRIQTVPGLLKSTKNMAET